MTTSMTNGRARKSLAEQIDRLDAILDGLADALNGAVAQAVTEAVAVAVKAAVAETLTNPDLRRRIVPTPERPSLLRRLVAKVRRGCAFAKAQMCRFGRWVATAVTGTAAAVATAVDRAWTTAGTKVAAVVRSVPAWPAVAWRLRAPALVALGVGGTVAAACYLAGPVFASAVGGVASAKDALAARLRRMAWDVGPTADR